MIQSTSNIQTQNIKALVYGLSGAGKTYLASTLLRGYKPLIISAEGGLLSLSDFDIPYIDITKDASGKILPQIEREARLLEVFFEIQKPEYRERFDTIVLDSLTEMSQCVKDKAKSTFADKAKTFDLWEMYSSTMIKLVKSFRDLDGYHKVFNVLGVLEKHKEGHLYLEFDLAGSLKKNIPGFFDTVLCVRKNHETDTRELICEDMPGIFAKNRGGRLNKVEPADLGLVFNKMLKKGDTNVGFKQN